MKGRMPDEAIVGLLALAMGACSSSPAPEPPPEDRLTPVEAERLPVEGPASHPMLRLDDPGRIYLVDQRRGAPPYDELRVRWPGAVAMPMSYWLGWVKRWIGLDLIRSDNGRYAVLSPPAGTAEGEEAPAPTERLARVLERSDGRAAEPVAEGCAVGCMGWAHHVSVCQWECEKPTWETEACPWCAEPDPGEMVLDTPDGAPPATWGAYRGMEARRGGGGACNGGCPGSPPER